jgi:putative acetyltransferase
VCDSTDDWVGALHLALNVYTDNAKAIRLSEKFGFAIEGTMRVSAMARFHPNPPGIAMQPLHQ